MPVAPVDTAEVVKAKEQFFTSYQLEQEKQEKIQLEMKAEEKKMGGMYKTLIFFKHVKPSISIQIVGKWGSICGTRFVAQRPQILNVNC